MSADRDTDRAPPPSEPWPPVTVPVKTIARTAADERIDGLLGQIEQLLAQVPSALKDSARESASMRSAFEDLRGEVRTYNGKQSNLEAKIDGLALQVQKQNEYFEENKEVFEFVKELRAGFAVFWSHASRLAAGNAAPTKAEAPEHDAEILDIRAGQQQ